MGIKRGSLWLMGNVRIVQRKRCFLADEFSIKMIVTPVHNTSLLIIREMSDI